MQYPNFAKMLNVSCELLVVSCQLLIKADGELTLRPS